jgi:Cellulose binding domain
MNASPRGGPAGMREPPRANRRPVPLGRRPWFQAAMAVAALGLVAASVTMLVWRNGPPSRHVASNCGLINCGASLPGPSISTQSHISKAHRPVSHAPAAPPPAPTPSPSPSQAPAPPPDVTLTFTSGSDRHDFDHFRDQLTLVNNGGRPVSGWTVQLTLPGDEIFSVETQPWWDGVPFEHWRVSGDTLTISADKDTETLAPGEPLSVSIHGRGRTTSPTGCTFNGAACPSFSGQQAQQPPQQQPFWQQDRQSSPPRDRRSWQQDWRSPLPQDQRSWQQDWRSPLPRDRRSWQQDWRSPLP